MKANERRQKIFAVLCRRRFEYISNLAKEFEVSERTIRRDLEYLGRILPIYTKTGRYGGGVYVEDGADMSQIHIDEQLRYILKKIVRCTSDGEPIAFSNVDVEIIERILEI